MMYILPGIIENDFENFTMGISVIQKNMSKIFYGKSNLYASKNISKIFNYLNINRYNGYGQSSWGPTGFIFCKNIKSGLKLTKDIQNFIELKKIKGINLRMVEGRNKGIIETKGLKMTKKNILHMISPQENVSPFDVNMACDAGYDLVIPYTNVNLTDVKALVQDAIFLDQSQMLRKQVYLFVERTHLWH